MQRASAMFRHVNLTDRILYCVRITLSADSSFRGLNKKVFSPIKTEKIFLRSIFISTNSLFYLSVPEAQENLGMRLSKPQKN